MGRSGIALLGLWSRRRSTARECHHAHDQHAHDRADASDVTEDVVDRADHQRRHDAEQIGVLQCLGERHDQLFDLGNVGLGPVPRRHRGRKQQQETADERPDAFAAASSSDRAARIIWNGPMVLTA